jgi:hypothetical protein
MDAKSGAITVAMIGSKAMTKAVFRFVSGQLTENGKKVK